MNQENYLEMKMLACGANVGVARVAVATFASELDFTVSDIEEIRVAVSEAVSNVVIHAYPDEEQGQAWVSARIVGQKLMITVRDEGIGIESVEEARQPSFSTRKPDHMGLGFAFMGSFMDELEVASRPGQGTTVTMTRQLKRQEAGQGESQDAGSSLATGH